MRRFIPLFTVDIFAELQGQVRLPEPSNNNLFLLRSARHEIVGTLFPEPLGSWWVGDTSVAW